MLKTTFNLEIRYLKIKKQDAKYERFFSSLKCKKQLFYCYYYYYYYYYWILQSWRKKNDKQQSYYNNLISKTN